jgi:hypothetical protein
MRWLPPIALALCLAAFAGCARRGDAPEVAAPVASDDDDGPAESPVPAAEAPPFDRAVAPFLDRHCASCHGGARPRGGIVLRELRGEAAGPEAAVWQAVARAVRSGAMPPPEKPRPTPAELDALNAWLDAAVFRAGCGGPARVTLRRLNRGEYNRTIRDLLGIDFRPADDFPADDVGYGFDNVADVLTVSPLLAEKYLAAAEQAVDRAFASPEARRRLLNPPEQDRMPYGVRGLLPVRDDARKGLVGVPPPTDPAQAELDRAGNVLRAFADRAYRRPVTYDELARLLRFVEESQRSGEGTEPGMRLALEAVLASPHFLFKVEGGGGPAAAGDWALATRLSYFLWGTLPDDDLFGLAAAGRLRDPRVLRGQVRRMLRDPRSRSLAEDFAAQWLGLRDLREFAPDPNRFPDFDGTLRRSMAAEPELFFDAAVREDRSVLEFLDADWTFLDGRLAQHYGVAGVEGDGFRRVSLAGTPRGGLVTMAGVLAVTSNPTRTSPVKRGRWVLENLLGESVPTPPPGADNFSRADTARGGTLRQRTERHRADPACAGCHARLDPLGFGLENFDAVGAWRTHDGGAPVDASGALPGGAAFDGPGGLRAYLRSRPDDFARCLAEKLLTYALGRGLTPADRCAVGRIVTRTRQGGYRFSALAAAVAASDPFRNLPTEGGHR